MMMATYTTTDGTVLQYPLTPAQWSRIKRAASSQFDQSMVCDDVNSDLFTACWYQYMTYLNGGTDDPSNLDDVMGWLESIASEKVNNPRSKFYIYG